MHDQCTCFRILSPEKVGKASVPKRSGMAELPHKLLSVGLLAVSTIRHPQSSHPTTSMSWQCRLRPVSLQCLLALACPRSGTPSTPPGALLDGLHGISDGQPITHPDAAWDLDCCNTLLGWHPPPVWLLLKELLAQITTALFYVLFLSSKGKISPARDPRESRSGWLD